MLATFIPLFIAVSAAMMGMGIISPIMPLYIRSFGAGGMAVGAVFAAFSVSRLLLGPVAGVLSDRVGRLKVLAACFLAYPLRYGLTGLLRRPAQVVTAQLLHGLTFAGLYVVGSAHLADAAGGATGFALSLFTAAFNLGGVVGGYLLALVQARCGYAGMYLAAAALSSLSLPLLLASAKLGSRQRSPPREQP